jgi:hypothetical protein
MDRNERLRYLCYRCYRCGALLTKYQILDRWEAAEKDIGVVHSALCKCGCRHITPSNPTLFEELTSPSIWKLWLYDVFIPWLRRRL